MNTLKKEEEVLSQPLKYERSDYYKCIGIKGVKSTAFLCTLI